MITSLCRGSNSCANAAWGRVSLAPAPAQPGADLLLVAQSAIRPEFRGLRRFSNDSSPAVLPRLNFQCGRPGFCLTWKAPPFFLFLGGVVFLGAFFGGGVGWVVWGGLGLGPGEGGSVPGASEWVLVCISREIFALENFWKLLLRLLGGITRLLVIGWVGGSPPQRS